MPRTKKACPCGSGLTYEKCCGVSKVFYSLDQVRWRRAGQSLRRNLGMFADQPVFSWDAARAQDIYLGFLDQHLAESDDDFTMERCFEWFIFDYKLTSGRTVIETFREEHSESVNEYETVLLKEWARSSISLYEVTQALAGEGLIIKDLLGRKVIKVRDVSAATDIEVGSVLLMRVLKVGEEFEFSTSGLALPGRYKEPLLERLRRDRREYFKKNKKAARGWVAYLRERAHIINAWVMDLGISGSYPEKDSPTGEGKERRVILAVANWQEVLKRFNDQGAFILIRELKDSSGFFRQATAAILGEPHTSNDEKKVGAAPVGIMKTTLYPVLGHIILTQRFMIVTAYTPALLSECRGLLEKHLQEMLIEVPGKRQGRGGSADGLATARSGGSKGENYSWLEPDYAAVACCVQDGLQALGYSSRQQRGAVKLWFDFCSKVRPSIRKTAVWAATVIYAFSRLEMENGLNQQELAGRYGVASSTISSRFRLLCQSLKLVAYDGRYSTKKPKN